MPGTHPAADRLFSAMLAGRSWPLPPAPDGRDTERDGVRQLIREVFAERYHEREWERFQARNALGPAAASQESDTAAYAGVITAENPASGPYQGTSFVWFPADAAEKPATTGATPNSPTSNPGSVAVLVIGTGGFGADAHILGRPGHRRRLQALARLHKKRLWVKPDLLDIQSSVPDASTHAWPAIGAALRKYSTVIYAAVPVTGPADRQAVEDLLDLFAHEHGVRFRAETTKRWQQRQMEMDAALFPRAEEDFVAQLLEERRFVILQGPPGTGKTRLATRVAQRYGSPTTIQFHPARTYEDFVVGLAPRPAEAGLAFTVRSGDLLIANHRAREGRHVLLIDEINRGDLARVLGEAIFLFEPSEPDRTVELPHPPDPRSDDRGLRLEPGLMVLGTRNTADRSIARIDLAIRRRFAFVDIWPDLSVVAEQNEPLATECFHDVLATFTEHADEAGLTLVPGHAYFLDPRPDQPVAQRTERVGRRIRFELLSLLRTYVEERLLGPATSEIEGLADRIEARIA